MPEQIQSQPYQIWMPETNRCLSSHFMVQAAVFDCSWEHFIPFYRADTDTLTCFVIPFQQLFPFFYSCDISICVFCWVLVSSSRPLSILYQKTYKNLHNLQNWASVNVWVCVIYVSFKIQIRPFTNNLTLNPFMCYAFYNRCCLW